MQIRLSSVSAAVLVMLASAAFAGPAAHAASSSTTSDRGATASRAADDPQAKDGHELVQQGASVSRALHICNEGGDVVGEGRALNHIPVYFDGDTSTGACLLRKGGVTSYGVQALQTSLDQCYGKDLGVDGTFANAMYRALIQVQRQIGVTADGIYGPNTGKAMIQAGDVCRQLPADDFR
ncbi:MULTISPECIES: peptidoglycan-binding domain-containing protein [Clavibacter]|uniref:Peptidoglycan-binding protein n=2 Tax=Clavibacter TaxID=1573 RepID=A0A399NUX8_9MICO|nr:MULTISPECIES: peptidoglycan-binding domain-containing protein [Clavibacter]KDP89760.1 hypothetical protein W824_15445 [Clavibacter cf. michiganensis LMG 26808]RII98000.1 peptidoglycan-binding protein [Clavibacter michiganensis]UKF25973.1 peptidoglycan-binding protein [Clavibacter sp. A6099]